MSGVVAVPFSGFNLASEAWRLPFLGACTKTLERTLKNHGLFAVFQRPKLRQTLKGI